MADLLLFFAFTSIIWPCGRDYMKSFSCIHSKLVMPVTIVTSSQTSSIMAVKKSKWLINCAFLHFTSIIWPCGRDNLESFSCIFTNFVMHVTNDQFSDKFNNGWKKSIWLHDLLRLFAFYINNLTLLVYHLSCSNLLCMSLISSYRTSSITAENN